MRKNKLNNFLKFGLLIIGMVLLLDHLLDLPEFIKGFGFGLGLSLELIGAYASKHDMTKFKEFKKRILKSIKG